MEQQPKPRTGTTIKESEPAQVTGYKLKVIEITKALDDPEKLAAIEIPADPLFFNYLKSDPFYKCKRLPAGDWIIPFAPNVYLKKTMDGEIKLCLDRIPASAE